MPVSLRELPSVDEVIRHLKHLTGLPHALLATETRAVLSERRADLLAGAGATERSAAVEVEQRLTRLLQPSLRRVINATGVILHTNLGRAPLSEFQPIHRYSNLEYDLESGRRGKRDVHTSRLFQPLLGKPAIVVNNNAAAVFLVLNELAAGREVVISRGELIEIGDGFRIPEIMLRSGVVLREVGTTNRTSIEDYRQAINERTALILRVHPSNFRISGFTARPLLSELGKLARESGIPVYEDAGSGCLVDLRPYGIDEPLISESLVAGASVVSFSCDKLLGGPQSGVITGEKELIERIRRNPLYRAFRVDKLILQSLETTLMHLVRENWPAIPALAMISAPVEDIRKRAERVATRLSSPQRRVETREGECAIGGGSTPDQTLPTWTVEFVVTDPNAFEDRLRQAAIPVIARIARDRIVLDMRTIADDEEEFLVASVEWAA